MHVEISNKKLKRAIEDDAELKRLYGAEMAKKIRLRMTALLAAESLAVFWPPSFPPERCHELKGDYAGIFSMDLNQPFRLLFKPLDESKELNPGDEKQRWQSIKSVVVIGIENTHG
jgi:plasmid maintenance system killer protein